MSSNLTSPVNPALGGQGKDSLSPSIVTSGKPSPSHSPFTPSWNDVTVTQPSGVWENGIPLTARPPDNSSPRAEKGHSRRSSAASVGSRHVRGDSYGVESDADMGEDMSERYHSNIKVVIRKRPRRPVEKGEVDVVQVDETGGQNVAVYEPKVKVDMTKVVEPALFQFDSVFSEKATNDEVYEACCRPLLDSVLKGNNAVAFAFGQTGSGKTHTMFGSPDGRQPGIYSLASRDLFASLKGMRLFASFFEIYTAKLYDLLNDRSPVQTRQDEYKNLHLVGLSEHDVRDFDALMALIQQGTAQRASGATHANDRSSRSHAVLVLTTKTRRDLTTFGKMTFVDLAGSERAADTTGMDKKTRMEGAEINKSLLALKECIRALDLRKRHVPFRGSKLTQVLRDSFVGNSTTLMISNVSPCQSHCEDTLNTLRYANRIKELKPPQEGEAGYIAPIPCVNCGLPIWSNTKAQHVCIRQTEKCPHCRKSIEKHLLDAHMAECGDASINCPYCGVRCVQATLKKHKKKCGKAPTTCPHCDLSVMRDALQRHLDSVCPNARIPCGYCKALVQRCDMESHQETCSACPINCPDCNTVIRRAKLHEHRLVCPIALRNARRASRFDPEASPPIEKKSGDLPPIHPRNKRRKSAVPTTHAKSNPASPRLSRHTSDLSAVHLAAEGSPKVGVSMAGGVHSSSPHSGPLQMGTKRTGCRYCGKAIPQSQKETHLQNDCMAYPISCSFADYGCKARYSRTKMAYHIRDNVAMHMELVKGHAKSLEEENLQLRLALAKSDHESSMHTENDNSSVLLDASGITERSGGSVQASPRSGVSMPEPPRALVPQPPSGYDSKENSLNIRSPTTFNSTNAASSGPKVVDAAKFAEAESDDSSN